MIIWFGRIIPSVQVLECWSVYACGCANFLHNSSCGDVFSVFVVKIVLMTQASFCYCWAVLAWSQGLFCSSPHPICEEAGSAQGIGTAHPRGYPTPYVVILVIQSWEKKEEWGAFVLIVHDGALLFWGWLNILPAHGNRWVNSMLCLCAWLLLYLLNCLYLNPWMVSILSLWFFPPFHVGGSEQADGLTWLPIGIKPWHLVMLYSSLLKCFVLVAALGAMIQDKPLG